MTLLGAIFSRARHRGSSFPQTLSWQARRRDRPRAHDKRRGGGAISLADVALVAYTRVAHEGGFDLSEYPAVAAWVKRVEATLPIG